MTLDELRDWHAKRAGLCVVCEGTIEEGWIDANGNEVPHPFPATLDAADASMPKGWDWWRLVPIRTGEVTRWVAMFLADPTKGAMIDATTDKIRDLYELSMKAWEQEAA